MENTSTIYPWQQDAWLALQGVRQRLASEMSIDERADSAGFGHGGEFAAKQKVNVMTGPGKHHAIEPADCPCADHPDPRFTACLHHHDSSGEQSLHTISASGQACKRPYTR